MMKCQTETACLKSTVDENIIANTNGVSTIGLFFIAPCKFITLNPLSIYLVSILFFLF